MSGSNPNQGRSRNNSRGRNHQGRPAQRSGGGVLEQIQSQIQSQIRSTITPNLTTEKTHNMQNNITSDSTPSWTAQDEPPAGQRAQNKKSNANPNRNRNKKQNRNRNRQEGQTMFPRTAQAASQRPQTVQQLVQNLDSQSGRNAIILSEIIGKPLSMRRRTR